MSRDEYESAANQLGQNPEIPDDPESVVYEVCYEFNDPEPLSARMYDGKKQDDEDGSTSIAGTYKGKIIDSEIASGGLLGEWEVQGTVEDNKIIIIVADDGTVTGSLYYLKIDNILLSDDGG